ncbi:AAA family ATPase [Thalassoroseus pseudoceratinae]|uniref:AAA family ATPase n=1 Tax=Thalassoroseus pseudoceratinae TaxID=2713176 RepID=UPI00141F821A|nr:MoxR family ATPase [Thalassoroseus pseudoceratinae]
MNLTPPSNVRQRLERLKSNLSGVIQGKGECIDILLVAVLAGGSVLMDDVPGVGKTTLAKALANSIDLSFQRVQFTPDLLPSDILGSSIYNPVDGNFQFRRGPIFCNVLLADEINRASPRTQSALLEAMSESQATIDGVCHPLHAPFFVLATQNPIDFHGTYPLPEAQLDRFLIQLHLGYPDLDDEVNILFSQSLSHPVDDLQPVLSQEELLSLQEIVTHVHVERNVAEYIVRIVQESRTDSRLKLGVSPRGSLMLFRAAQATAYQAGRDFVLPDDVQKVAPYVLPHRVVLTSKAKYGSASRGEVVQSLLERVDVPV